LAGNGRFPFRRLRGEERREYEAQRSEKHDWVFVQIDRDRTDFVDLDAYAKALFHSLPRQEAFVAVVKLFAEKRKALYLKDVIYAEKRPIVSNTTLNSVWKSMLRSGVIYKKNRQDPAQLSTQFAERLKDAARYWENFLATAGTRRKGGKAA
jgi:hypothetical protein